MSGDPLSYVFYPILFLALFFETFLLLTFLSRPARHARERARSNQFPRVSLIVPCYNEEETVAMTAASVLALDYPPEQLQLILVNDGSKDGTLRAMAAFKDNPRVLIIDKENGGKHTALNAGIEAAATAEYVGCVDADSYLAPDALSRTLACFTDDNVAAAFSSIAIGSPRRLIEHMQGAEYMMGSYFRHALSSINAFFVTPGPFSVYRRDILVALGNFRFGQQTEDMEIAMRLLRHGYTIGNAPGALVTTRAQNTLSKLVHQRMRWASGYFRNLFFDYRDLVSHRYGFLGLFVLPMGFLTPFLIITSAVVSLYLIISNAMHFFASQQTVPFAWSVSHFSHVYIDWFYFPVNSLSLLAFTVLVLSALTAYLGKRISGTHESVARGVIVYVLLYAFIAPVWFARSIIDVSTGTRRGWRD